MHRSLRGLAGLAAVLVIATACGSNDATLQPQSPGASPTSTATGTPSAAASASPSPAPPSSSADAGTACDPAEIDASPEAPSPDANDPNAAVYTEIEGQVSDLRGLAIKTPVQRGVFDKPGLCAYLAASFAKQNPPELVADTETIYKALLLMPQDASLKDLYLELLTSQVAGLYDDETKKMYVVTSTGKIGPVEEVTYAHEYTHALQDQHFNLKQFTGDATDQGDRQIARSAVVEGDATLLMSLWAQQHLTPAELAEVAGASDPASQAVLDRAPAILRESLLFPYTSGLQITLGAFQRAGGFSGVDALFADPPATTEQVLHPDKLQAREPAVAVSFPADLASRLGDGWTVAQQDTLGEFQLRVFLSDAAQAAAADTAAAGWGGDRAALITGPGGANAVVIDTAWDTDGDAAEFADALRDYPAKLQAAGRAGAVLTPSAGRVVVISASDADTLGRVANVLGLAG